MKNRLIELEKELSIRMASRSYSLTRRRRHRRSRAFSDAVNYMVQGIVPVVSQDKSMTCWAAATTMLLSWQQQQSMSIADIMAQIGQKYLDLYNDNKGLSASEKPAFAVAAGLLFEPPANYTIKGWEQLLRQYGPLWVTTASKNFAIHGRVMKGIVGDGTPDGTQVHLIDPNGGREYSETFTDFVSSYEREIGEKGVVRLQVIHLPPSVAQPFSLSRQSVDYTSINLGVDYETAMQVPPSARICCILAPTTKPWSKDSNLADPSNLGIHGQSTEANGLIYTGKAGFLDLGHLRDLCDLTKHIYDQIKAGNGSPSTITTTHGTAQFQMTAIPSVWIEIAQALAYDDSYGYEIATYSAGYPGGHNSAFSPEDLFSNYLGTILAMRAIENININGGKWNDVVTKELDQLIWEFDPQNQTESLNAFNLINHRWVDFNDIMSLAASDYLKRRNFTRVPWKAGHKSDKPIPLGVTAPLNDHGAYTYTHTSGRNILKTSFATEVAKIQADAKKKYGTDFDKP